MFFLTHDSGSKIIIIIMNIKNYEYCNRKTFRGGYIFVYFVVEQKPRNVIQVFMTDTANGS